jgi:hypothetical protein
MTRRARVLAAVLGLVAVLGVLPAATAQRRLVPPPQPERHPFLDGTHAFRRILYDVSRKKLKPLGEKELIEPNQTLVVVLGDPSPLLALNKRLGGLRSFVERGGALLVATDQQSPPVLQDAFGVQVNGTHITMPKGGPDTYRDMPECLYISSQPGARPPLFEPTLNAARNDPAKKVASNLPSYLEVGFKPSFLPVLGFLPPATDGRGPLHLWNFAAGDAVGSGRVLIMADQDVFINEMMLQKDNGNIDFAYRCADWLLARSDGGGKRKQILYYEDGTIQTDFDIPLKQLPIPPLPPPDTLMGMLDEMLPAMEQEGFFAQLEEDDVANGAVESLAVAVPIWAGTRPEWKLWTLAAILGSVVLGLYAFVRMGTFRHRPETAGLTLAELVRNQAPAGAVMAQRQEELLRDGNLWEAARDLARNLFVSTGISPDAGPVPPAIEVRGSWWRRWWVRLRWRQLWRLARSARPVRVSPQGFARLANRVGTLRSYLVDGTVRIIP